VFVFGMRLGARDNCGGLWRFLTARAQAKASLQRQLAQDGATAAALHLLPHGASLLEIEADGRLRLIRMPPLSGSELTETKAAS
jgi:hypothetical protein